ncbi:MAG: restriction endonuclease subunit S, partial [Candidatus Woesearchaeota archaeon]
KQKKKVELLKEMKKGYMQKLFNQELRFKDENRNEYPEWENVVLGEIATFNKGKNISKKDITISGNECIRYGELYTFYNEVIKDVKSRTHLKRENLVLSEKNDLLIPASGETREDIAAAACIQKNGVAIGGDINILKTDIDNVFLAYYLNNGLKNSIARLAQGASILHLYASQLKGLKLRLPVIEEQNKISAFLSFIDNKIKLEDKMIQELAYLKNGYMQRLFREPS